MREYNGGNELKTKDKATQEPPIEHYVGQHTLTFRNIVAPETSAK